MRNMSYFFLAFLLLAGSAFASEWLRVGDTAGGEKNYIDMESVEHNRSLINFWARNIDRKGEATETSYAINCEKGTGAIREIRLFDSNALLVKSYSFSDNNLQWSKMTPRSFMRIFRKVLCEDTALNPD
jgi:hypothetical protein